MTPAALLATFTTAGLLITRCVLWLAEYDRRANELHAEPGTNTSTVKEN